MRLPLFLRRLFSQDKRRNRGQVVIGRSGGRAIVALLTVVPEESTAVRRKFSLAENIPGTPYFVEGDANHHSHEIIQRQCDRGTLATQEAATQLVEEFRPEFILLVGIAGGGRRAR